MTLDPLQQTMFLTSANSDEDGEQYKVSFSGNVSRLNTETETVVEAIERVYDNASDDWKAQAKEVIYRLCQNRAEFDLDDVAIMLTPIDHIDHEPRATGQLLRNAVKDGWCRRSGVRNSKRKSRHYGYIAIYESLVYFPQA